MGFKKYNLTDGQLVKIARLCVQEQGRIEGVRAEASQAANLLETNKYYRDRYGSDVYNFMRNSGWYYRASHYMDEGSASSSAINAVRDVLVNGNRSFPQYVDEHDCINDIDYIKLHGEKVSKTDKSNYKQGQTIIKNKMGSLYTFYAFPAPGCDPFGYTQAAYDFVRGGGSDGGEKTEGSDADKMLEVAAAEVGYLEKKSNKDLDDKTANAGSGNFTKYWRDMDPSLQGEAWCDCFVSWCFKKAYGETTAKQLLCGGLQCFYTPESAQCFKDKGQWYANNPKKGDVIYFRNSERICHTGIVEKVTDDTVYTIEGNTSAGEQVIPNGGAVCKKSYKLYNTRIEGYGRPDYSAGSSEEKPAEKVWFKAQVRKLSLGDHGDDVKVWQVILGLKPDGDFGDKTRDVTLILQKDNGLKVTGIVGQKEWAVGMTRLYE